MFSKLVLRIIFTVTSILFCQTAARTQSLDEESKTFKPGRFYYFREPLGDSQDYSRIKQLMGKADVKLICKTPTKFKLNYIDDEKWQTRHDILDSIAKAKPSKELLVVHLVSVAEYGGGQIVEKNAKVVLSKIDRYIPCPSPLFETSTKKIEVLNNITSKIRPFLEQLNFKRTIVIASAYKNGLLVLDDRIQ